MEHPCCRATFVHRPDQDFEQLTPRVGLGAFGGCARTSTRAGFLLHSIRKRSRSPAKHLLVGNFSVASFIYHEVLDARRKDL